MDSFNTKLGRIEVAKNNIKQSLIDKGIKVGDNLEDYSEAINNIESSSGDVKLFKTKEEMQADSTAKVGDLAIIYRNEIQNAQVNSKFQTATFPDTVVLDSVITDYVDIRYRAVDSSKMFDCRGSLDSSMFMMDCYTESGSVRIMYESSDGITYTRTDITGNPVDFGTEIYYEYAEMWNDVIGKFIQVGGSTFEGLYEYNDSDWVLAPTQLSVTSDYVYEKEFYGKNGIETGTLQNKDNLTVEEILHRVNIWSDYSSGIVCPDNMNNMFESCTNLTTIPLLDTSKVTNMSSMFHHCYNLNTVPLLNTNRVTNMSSMFHSCYNLTSIPQLNMGNVTNTSYMFGSCYNLSSIPLLNTSSVTNMSGMFYYCNSLTTIPLLDTSSVTNIADMFYNCYNLVSISEINTINVTNVRAMFSNCVNLISVPKLNINSATNTTYMFSNCVNLTTIPVLNIGSVTNMYYMFNRCTKLSNESLDNILAMCANATSYTNRKTLAYIGLTSAQATKCTTLSNYSTFTAAGWTTGY